MNDLWKYDVATGNWTWMKGSNAFGTAGTYGTQGTGAAANTPGGRQNASPWNDGNGNLWLLGGNANSALNDLWKYNIATNTWTWVKGSTTSNQVGTYGIQGTPTATTIPGARNSAYTWADASGNLWLFGGYGMASSGGGYLNDLWKYNIASGRWTWMKGSNVADQTGTYGVLGLAATTNTPGGRYGGVNWIDANGNFWLLNGFGYGTNSNVSNLNDIWKYDIATGNWTWVKGNPANPTPVVNSAGVTGASSFPGARRGSASWTDASGNLWMFGGNGYTISASANLNDLWKYDILNSSWTWVSGSSMTNYNGVYGTIVTPAATNIPGARQSSITWKDNSGNLWLFGGYGVAASGSGYLNDLWKFNIASGQWTWMKGSNTANSTAVYGTLGVAAATNTPGARNNSISWTDASGNLWLFGGMGYNAGNSTGTLSDLWKYDIATGNWTWMKGSSMVSQVGIYGTIGIAATTNNPGARQSATAWTDNSGNLWLFGGVGNGSGTFGALNDLWKYDTATGNWLWMKGSDVAGQTGVYGIQGIATAVNTPGGRTKGAAWKDNTGNLWLYGGSGWSATLSGYLNDIWKYDIATGNWTWMKGSLAPGQLAIYGTAGISAATNAPGARLDNVSWTDNNGTLWIFGGDGYTASTSGTLSDFWKYKYCNALNLAVAAGGQTLAANHTTILAAGVLANFEADCAVSTAVLPNGISPAVGITTAKVWVESAEPTAGSNLFIRRHYEVNPVLNAGTATGRITLYATQADFDNFNLTATSKLPTSPTDLDGIGRLRVFKYNGTSSNSSGLPATYSGNFTEMYVGQSGITWNSNSNWWEISLNVSGFGGFFIGSSNLVLLPLDLTGFSATRQLASSVLQWTTTQNKEIATYSVERSADGRSFQTIGLVVSNSALIAGSYSFTDVTPLKGSNYYRLKMTGKDGKQNYSNIQLLNYGSQINVVGYPNPAKDKITLIGLETGMNIRLTEITGKVLKVQKAINSTENLSLSGLSNGLYSVQVYSTNGNLITTLRITKQ